MSTTIEAGSRPARKCPQASSKHHVTNQRFALLLEEDFGIPAATVLDALIGEPQRRAIALCEWAERTDDPAFALVAWSKKHNRGRCRRAARTTERPARRHGSPRDDRAGDGRGSSGPARRRGVSGGLDPARVRANLERMGG